MHATLLIVCMLQCKKSATCSVRHNVPACCQFSHDGVTIIKVFSVPCFVQEAFEKTPINVQLDGFRRTAEWHSLFLYIVPLVDV